MSSNQRDSNRIGIVIEIKIICDDKSEFILKSRNISDNGVFLEHENKPISLIMGTQVILQVCSQLNDGEPPPVKAEVVRVTDEGYGLKFIL